MSGCDHKFRQHSQCSWDTRNLSLGLCHSKMFLFPIKNEGWRQFHPSAEKNPLANQGTERFGEATSPHRNPPPFPSWKAFKPLCWDPNCQGLLCCRCTLPFYRAGPRNLCVFKALMYSLRDSSSDLSRYWQSCQCDSFSEVKEGKVGLATNCLARFRLVIVQV